MELQWVWFIRIGLGVMGVLLGCDACLDHEKIALLQLKPFFNDYYHELADWDEGNASNCCDWERIQCNTTTKRIIRLSLNYTKMFSVKGWYLNASMFLPFVELKSLSLQGNAIAGCIEKEGFAKLSTMLNNLEFLDLSENRLDDRIMSSLSELSSLRHLSLANNQLEGSNHLNGFRWFSRLDNLKTLDLSSNSLKNDIMFHVSGLSSLKTLILGSNGLEGNLGHIPGLNNLTNLKYLDLSWNKIESILNQDQTQLRLTRLEELDLSGNLFRNNAFSFPKELSSLKYLIMERNNLQGSLDIKGLNYLTNLKRLYLSGNRIEAFNLAELEELDLSSNLFRNNTFSFLFLKKFSSLEFLNMEGNKLEGSLDIKESSNLRNLKKLDLSGNRIESLESFKDGDTKLMLLTHLEELHLDSNLFNNSVFASLNWISNLKSLSINQNQLEGSLDMKDLDVFAYLRELDLSGNQLKDFVIHEGLGYLKKLQVLDLSENAFEGMLPHCLGNMTSLRELDISDNQFSGNLTLLANLTLLTSISLARNHFQIPMSLEPLVNLPNLKVFSGDENKMVMGPSFVPKFQLEFISLSNCITSQELGLEFLTFLYHQHELRYVDLSGNNFSGRVPFWLLRNNAKLEYLKLRNNSLSGPLVLPSTPNFNLFLVDISDNKLQGQIPSNICSTFPYLRLLFLSKNFIRGNLPSCLSGKNKLSDLDLSNNQLSGSVPEELISNNPLSILRLSNNNLSGNVVPVILKANVLQKLYLDGNNFSGEMANIGVSTFRFPTSLQEIDLSNNKLYGKLPRWVGNWSGLEKLVLSNNRFEGSIPMEFCNLNELEYLDLSQNNLSGSIPSCFNPPNIQHVHLHGNKLNGPLSLAFHNSSSLVTLDLSGNNLRGSIPKWIGTLSSLSVLLLKANHLHGRIPVQLCKLYSLNIIDLSQNMFSGHIPSCLGNLTFPMQFYKIVRYHFFMDFSEEDISASFESSKLTPHINYNYPDDYKEEWIEFTTKRMSYSYGGKILEYMTGIDLSCNKLIGQIPPELGNLNQIHSLNLSYNNLIGDIPSSFSKLKQIESLDLSYNNLSGEIPNKLIELNSLEIFSVAHNNLSGRIPEPKAQFGTFDESSYEGNPFLCGPMLHKSCSKTPSTAAKDDGEDEILLDIYVFRVSFLISYAVMFLTALVVLYINPYWRKTWFYFVEKCITTCRYSTVGNFLTYYIFRRCV
ncbi:hypothetical protein GQ457_01G033300 [Hibiscus cannabinus]